MKIGKHNYITQNRDDVKAFIDIENSTVQSNTTLSNHAFCTDASKLYIDTDSSSIIISMKDNVDNKYIKFRCICPTCICDEFLSRKVDTEYTPFSPMNPTSDRYTKPCPVCGETCYSKIELTQNEVDKILEVINNGKKEECTTQ